MEAQFYNGAMAIFVKTPGLSPTKTRLAAEVGRPAADRFYRNSIDAMKALAAEASLEGVKPYWALAEMQAESVPRWKDLERVQQGSGGLGERLDTVYRRLLARHEFVLLVGADCPHLPIAHIREAAKRLHHADFVIGPTDDGGFYLFGGRRPVASTTWRGVPYSTDTTLLMLERGLPSAPQHLPLLFDVDTKDDLLRLGNSSISHLPSGQQAAIKKAIGSIHTGSR